MKLKQINISGATNGAGQLVSLDGSARLPAVDGSQLTGISGGGARPSIYDVSTNTTIGSDTAISSSELERIYIVDSSSAITMTLPEITGNVGEGYKIQIKRDGANNVTITANAADKIENGSDGGSVTLSTDKSSFTLVCANTPANKANWYII